MILVPVGVDQDQGEGCERTGGFADIGKTDGRIDDRRAFLSGDHIAGGFAAVVQQPDMVVDRDDGDIPVFRHGFSLRSI